MRFVYLLARARIKNREEQRSCVLDVELPMQKVVIIVVLFCGCLVPSALANNVTTDDGNGLNIPTGIPTLTDPLPTEGVKEAWNKSINNFTHLFYETCNITSCNPLHYKHCYHDKVAQLIIHAIAVILGVVFAFFGKQ